MTGVVYADFHKRTVKALCVQWEQLYAVAVLVKVEVADC